MTPRIAIKGKNYINGIYTDSFRIARKEYTCSVCSAKIRKGDLYIKRVFRGERGYANLHVCMIHADPALMKVVDARGKTLWERNV